MVKNRGGMGNRKHGTSGHPGKSPKLRLQLKMQAEKDLRKPRHKTEMYNSVTEAFKHK